MSKCLQFSVISKSWKKSRDVWKFCRNVFDMPRNISRMFQVTSMIQGCLSRSLLETPEMPLRKEVWSGLVWCTNYTQLSGLLLNVYKIKLRQIAAKKWRPLRIKSWCLIMKLQNKPFSYYEGRHCFNCQNKNYASRRYSLWSDASNT